MRISEASGVAVPDPLDILRAGAASFAPHIRDDGECVDPVVGEPTQYATPYHAWVRLALGDTDAALPVLDAALRHLEDPALTPNPSGVHRSTFSVAGLNHRDFFWPPVVRCVGRLLEAGHPQAGAFADRLAAIRVPDSFRTRGPSNWAAVWIRGEWRRIRLGRSPHDRDTLDRWLDPFFDSRLLPERGLYLEPGHPNSYDLFTRLHLAELLADGYDGRWREALETLARRGLDRSLAMQLSDGSLASAHRSTGQTWTLGAQCALFALYAGPLARLAGNRQEEVTQAAHRALAALALAQRKDGPFSPVQNQLPPEWRVGYEGYTADAHYGNLALGFLACAIDTGFPAAPSGRDRDPFAWADDAPLFRALAHAGPCSAHVNAWPAPAYDAFGLADLTVGPGRFLQWGTPVTHLPTGERFLPGLARIEEGQVLPLSAEAHALAGPIRTSSDAAMAGIELETAVRGEAFGYRLAARVTPRDIHIEEALPGRTGPLALLVPYLLDPGTGTLTEVAEEGPTVVFRHGPETVRLHLDACPARVRVNPYGFENRRGRCGLARIDLARPAAGLSWRLEPDR